MSKLRVTFIALSLFMSFQAFGDNCNPFVESTKKLEKISKKCASWNEEDITTMWRNRRHKHAVDLSTVLNTSLKCKGNPNVDAVSDYLKVCYMYLYGVTLDNLDKSTYPQMQEYIDLALDSL